MQAVVGLSHPGDFDKISAPDVMCQWACCLDEAANHQLPTAVAF